MMMLITATLVSIGFLLNKKRLHLSEDAASMVAQTRVPQRGPWIYPEVYLPPQGMFRCQIIRTINYTRQEENVKVILCRVTNRPGIFL